MGEIKLQTATRASFGAVRAVTSQIRYSTIPSDLLIARVAQTANIKESTAKAAILGFKEAIRYFVMNGHSVNLGKFGYLKAGVQAQSVAQAKQVSAELIKGVKVAYTPSKEIKAELASINFTKN